MSSEMLVERFFETLITGDRPSARALVADCGRQGSSPEDVLTELFWPAYEMVERLYRSDQLTRLSYHFATRLLRVLVDQSAGSLVQQARTGRTIFAVCGPSQADELGAQIAVDLLEASGFTVSFAGGGIPSDEIQAQVHEYKPDILLMFAAAPGDLPDLRATIDSLREIGACPNVQIAVGGGVFNRAEGLAEEIGADIWASNPLELVDTLLEEPARRAAEDQRTVGRKRKVKAAA